MKKAVRGRGVALPRREVLPQPPQTPPTSTPAPSVVVVKSPPKENPSAQWERLKNQVESDLQVLNGNLTKLEIERENFERKKRREVPDFGEEVKLDVGGKVFRVQLEVLLKERSVLSEMFSSSGKVEVKKDEDGCYFIDRPGRYFGLVLGYLQTGVVVLPGNEQRKKAFLKEVEFYEIQSLLDILKRKSFVFSNVNDKNGILYWLGTQKGTSSSFDHVNHGDLKRAETKVMEVGAVKYPPSFQNFVKILGSSNPTYLNFHTNQQNYDAGGCTWLNNSITIEFVDIYVIPSSYSLSYASASGCHRPYNWKLEGFAEEKWITLKVHSRDTSLTNQNRANWEISKTNQEFSKFKITCTGCDAAGQSNCNCFHICNLEIYGDVIEN